MAVQKTDAIVIGYYPLGEADRIVVFYTRDHGKVRAVAKGIRKLKSRLCGKLELLTHGVLVFFERANSQLHIVDSFDITESFQTLREDLLKMAYCSYIAELIGQIKPEGDPDPDTFDLIMNIMLMMKTSTDPEMLTRAFEIRLLTAEGLGPKLDSCAICSSGVDEKRIGFSVSAGGILCGKCSQLHPSVYSVSKGTIELMKRMQRTPISFIPRLKISALNRQELKKTLPDFISFHVELGSLHSLDFLTSIETEYKGRIW
ncbi:MAG: DNA repair protein RecO [Halobacteria archaeon]